MDVVGDRGAMVLGFLAALSVLGVIFWFVGIGELLRTIARADALVVALMFPVAAAWLVSWGYALRTVLGRLGVSVSPWRAFLTFSAATFANNVTPFGQAGGEPITAYIISTSADTEYETGLAAIASVDTLHFVPTIGLATVGLAFFATRFTFGRRLQLVTGAVVLMAVAVPVLVYGGWRYREVVEGVAVRTLSPVVQLVGRVIPRRDPPSEGAVRHRVQGFFGAIGRIAGDPRKLALALGFSLAGWLAIMTSLWLALFALGHTVHFAVVLVAIPVASMAGVTPLPGGLGALDGVLIGLLAILPGVGPAAAGAAVVLHRVATYWLPVVVGAAAAGVLTARGR